MSRAALSLSLTATQARWISTALSHGKQQILPYPVEGGAIEPNPSAGILSEATTATKFADVKITVFSTPEKRAEAEARVQATGVSFTPTEGYYVVSVGCISVDLSEFNSKPSKILEQHAAQIEAVLRKAYK